MLDKTLQDKELKHNSQYLTLEEIAKAQYILDRGYDFNNLSLDLSPQEIFVIRMLLNYSLEYLNDFEIENESDITDFINSFFEISATNRFLPPDITRVIYSFIFKFLEKLRLNSQGIQESVVVPKKERMKRVASSSHTNASKIKVKVVRNSIQLIQSSLQSYISNSLITLPTITRVINLSPTDIYYLSLLKTIKLSYIKAIEVFANKPFHDLKENEKAMYLFKLIQSLPNIPIDNLMDIDWSFLLPNYNRVMTIYIQTLKYPKNFTYKIMRLGNNLLRELLYCQTDALQASQLPIIEKRVIAWLIKIAREALLNFPTDYKAYFIFKMATVLQKEYLRMFGGTHAIVGINFPALFWQINWDFLLEEQPKEP